MHEPQFYQLAATNLAWQEATLQEFQLLRQASRQWFSKLSEALISRGYISSLNDYSLFTKSTADCLVVLAVYVDDILLAGSDISEISLFFGPRDISSSSRHFSSVPTLLDPSVKLTMDMGEPFSDPSLYRRLVEKLNFLQNTRPDMSFSV
uniref:Uncharacterized protein LOC104238846 n=1 Tax=Nicotiana sylvestris TaxID=4096 RepID=A0A1U7XXC7_NICSY|nr:PREDICTED: uncharacterized protein LOC104238846 [Nicotiana sylvestris]